MMGSLLRPLPVHSYSHVSIARRSMAGHNKWSKIKKKKGIKDVAKLAQLTKATRAIIVASRACQGDMSNLQLQSAISRAKAIEVPRVRIDAAVQNFMKQKDSCVDLTVMRYDTIMSFDGAKVACLITALTDNRNRTSANVKSAVRKAGGEMLPSSSHDYLFKYAGAIVLENILNEDAMYECALEAGATAIEYEEASQSAFVMCEATDLWQVVVALQEQNFATSQFEHRYVLQDADSTIEVTEEGQEAMERFLDTMDEDEDVTNVFHNAKIVEEEEMEREESS